jgi:beta-galactosidase/beta-glucuronidase
MPDINKDPESDEQFRYELKQIINTHFNHPSIIMWVPFNEGWGQYNTSGITNFVKELDRTRLVNSA